MENKEKKDKILNFNGIKGNSNSVHVTLAHSYLFYFILLIVAIFLDLFYPIGLFINLNISIVIGFLFIFLSSLLIFFAQKSSRKLYSKDIVTKESFYDGPYRYTRMPTHFGLLFLMVGFGFIMNAFFVIVFTLISFIFTKIFFIKKQEDFLEEKYGEHYKEYKKTVKF